MKTLPELTALTDDELNVMLAELCGIQTVYFRFGTMTHGHPEWCDRFKTEEETNLLYFSKTTPTAPYVDHGMFPRYTGSLDEVAKVVDFVRQDDLKYFYYQMHLNSVMAIYNSLPERQAYRSIATCDAPPRQRTIALVATLQMK